MRTVRAVRNDRKTFGNTHARHFTTYGLVVFLDFAYSCRAGQFDTDGKIFLEGRSEDPLSAALLLLLSWRTAPRNVEKGAGF